ncbi:DUF3500 domain-containing protein [Streptomyces sp. NPDC059740]|uniref:DUF3500 domain-containing protein n=1 Tax=Streptomyces sp. NPDC059740 TaxID=3346926 RepID=UPI00365EBBD5
MGRLPHARRRRLSRLGPSEPCATSWGLIHSPVVWVEVDCQAAGPLGGAYGASRADGPTQKHVHSVIRTPNGNDYDRELLRQHYATSPHHR